MLVSFVDIVYIFPELLLFCTISYVVLFSIYYSTKSTLGYPILSVHLIYTSIFVLLVMSLIYLSQPQDSIILFSEMYTISRYTQLIKSIICILGFCVLAASVQYIKLAKLNQFEFPILLLLGLFGLITLISANNLILLYIAVELQTLCFYVLTAAHRSKEIAVEAGLKYLIFGAFSSGLLLFGISLVYAATGISSLDNLAILFLGTLTLSNIPKGTIFIGLLLLCVGVLFKMYAAPFHVWVPDIYQGAPTAVVLFFATIPGFVLSAFLVRLFTISTFFEWDSLLYFVAVCSMLVGCFCAIYQKDVTRIIAYSSIMNIGFILSCLAASEAAGVSGIFIYQLLYVTALILFFSVILCSFSLEDVLLVKHLRDLSSFAKEQPVLSVLLSISVFSMAGFPPLAGFFSKLYVFQSLVTGGLYIYLVIGLGISGISAFYYLRFAHIAYFVTSDIYRVFKRVSKELGYIQATSSVLLLFFFLEPSIVLMYSDLLNIVVVL